MGLFYFRSWGISFIIDPLRMQLTHQIREIAEHIVESSGAYLVELVIRGEGRSKVVELFIDTDAGVTSDKCADISKELAQKLESSEVVKGSYNLVVSSPGLERSLKLPRQYKKNIGRVLKVKYKTGLEVRLVEGELLEVTPERLVLRRVGDNQIEEFPFDKIVETHIRLAW